MDPIENKEVPVNTFLIEYNRLYSEYMAMLVELHNYHTRFLKFTKVRERPGYRLRKHIKKMNEVAWQMAKMSTQAEVKQTELFPLTRGTPVRSTNPRQMAKPGKTKKHVDIPGSDNRRVTR